MCLLLANKGKVLTKDAIVSHVWPGEHVGYNSVSLLIHDVRFIMRDFRDFNNTNIITVRKEGYVLISAWYEIVTNNDVDFWCIYWWCFYSETGGVTKRLVYHIWMLKPGRWKYDDELKLATAMTQRDDPYGHGR